MLIFLNKVCNHAVRKRLTEKQQQLSETDHPQRFPIA